MAKLNRPFLKKIAMVIAVFISAAAAVYALQLWLIGPEIRGVFEGSPVVHINHAPAPAAVIPLVASLLLIAGLLLQRYLISWVGLVFLSIFAGLFLFGIGGIFIPVSAILFLLLITIQVSSRNLTSRKA